MKMSKQQHVFKMLAFIVLAIVGVGVADAMSLIDMSAIISSIADSPYTIALAFPVAMATGEGTVADETVTIEKTAEESENLLRPDISRKITKILPSSVPLDTLIREAGAHEKTEGIQFKFYSSELRKFSDVLAAEFTNGGSAASHEITVGNAHTWQVDDGILFHGIKGSDGKDLVGHIVAKTSSTKKLKVVFLNGTGADTDQPPASIEDGTKVGRLANAKSELDAQTAPYGHLPLDEYNFVQAHMAHIQESVWQKLHAKEVQWDERDMQAMSIFDLRSMMEATSFFGYRKKIYDPEDADYKYLSGGAIRFINKKLTYDPVAGIDDEDFQSWTKQLFVGNAGSDKRYAFVGSSLMERLGALDLISKQIDGKSTEIVYGVTFNKIETNFGIIMLKHHALFNDYGWQDGAVVLDLNHVRKRVYEPMKIRRLNLIDPGIKKANSIVIEETFGLEFRYPDTHALILPASEY